MVYVLTGVGAPFLEIFAFFVFLNYLAGLIIAAHL
jgi:hypothetical protein